MAVGFAAGTGVLAGGEVCGVVAEGVGAIRTSCGVVPGLPGMLVTCAPDVAPTPSGVVAGDDPDCVDEHADSSAAATNARATLPGDCAHDIPTATPCNQVQQQLSFAHLAALQPIGLSSTGGSRRDMRKTPAL